jgi:hypothetical protein
MLAKGMAALLVVLALGSPCPAAGLSDIRGKDLNGGDFDLFGAAAKKPSLVLIGFSHAAGDRCDAWGKELWADAGSDTRMAILSLVMLSKAPAFVRPFIRHVIRSATPEQRQSSTIIVVERAPAWEEHFAAELKADPDQCFVLRVSAAGEPSCEMVGAFSPERLTALKDCLGHKAEDVGSHAH